MRSFGDLSISLKLKLIIMATSGVALLMACATFVAYDQASTRRMLADDISTDARIIGTNVTAALTFKDHEAAVEVLSGLSLRPNITQARVYDNAGAPFASYSRGQVQAGGIQPAAERMAPTFKRGCLVVSEPITIDNEDIGTVCLIADAEQLNGRLHKYSGIVGLVLLGSFIIALTISSKLQRVISRPILQLAETARAVSNQKDYSIRAPKHSGDETGALIDGFNEMLEQIERRDEQLHQRNESLQAEIEKRLLIEHALREGDERYRALLAESSEAIWRLELEHPLPITLSEEQQITHLFQHGYLAECNDVMARIHDRSCANEMVGMRLAALIISPELLIECLNAFIRSGYRLIDRELKRIDQAGRDRYFLHNLSGIVEDGRLVRAWGVQREITERKQAETRQVKLETQLRQAQKMEAIGTLAGGIAHDFNNILGAIIGYSELAALDINDKDPSQAHLAEVLRAAKRAKELVRQILSFSRQEEHERKPIQLASVIDEALKLLRASLPSTIEIRTQIDSGAGPILADPTQVHQVMMNLCTNSWHSMNDDGGILEVSMRPVDVDSGFAQTHADLQPGRYLRLMISDTGCGIEPAVLDRIFDPFFTTKAPGSGTGLGLAVVHGVVKSHGGAISVYSEQGKGTTFNLYFPVHEAQADAAPVESISIAKGNGERILFVDDEAPLAAVGKSMLERLGYRVTEKTNSLDALAAFTAQPGQFDLVITDQTMPNLSGAELAKLMLKIRPELPVILATGYSTTINAEKANAIGIREMLLKPNTAQTMSEAVRRALGQNGKEN
jgi:signal transduction histidine kinase/ActR/RegA family two-component response regulator/HAMP domain-containing protein